MTYVLIMTISLAGVNDATWVMDYDLTKEDCVTRLVDFVVPSHSEVVTFTCRPAQ